MLNHAFARTDFDEVIMKRCAIEIGDMKQVWMLMLSLGVLLSMAGCEREKDRLDAEVRRLCAQDGGVKVYEQVTLPSERFDDHGSITFYYRMSKEPLGPDYHFETQIDYYRKGSPEMWRNQYRVIRLTDGKVLGESVSYGRRGGDLPGSWDDSSFQCPDHAEDSSLLKQVFVKAK